MVLQNSAAERIVLAGICKYGTDAYYDVSDIIEESTFTIESNAYIYRCIKNILEQDDTTHIDISSIQAASQHLNLEKFFYKAEEIRHLQAIFDYDVDLSNVRKYAVQIRKLEIAKLLRIKLNEAQDKLLEITGQEPVYDIVGLAENPIFNFVSSLSASSDNSPAKVGEGLSDYIKYLADNPVEQIGIATGFPRWDLAIGGGVRPGTVNVIGARPKAGKTNLANNMCYFIAKSDIPVLNLDTEMLIEDHKHRLCAKLTKTDIRLIENGKFGDNKETLAKVIKATQEINNLPYYHKSIADLPLDEQLAIARRWIVKEVGLKADGTAKDCVIIYDYLKLMNASDIGKSLQEYQAIGFMMTALHNFAVKYKVPIIAFVQLNRDGVDIEDTRAASGSDRIVWLCSNFSIFKKKSLDEMGKDGPEAGNRKLIPIVARHGQEKLDNDYINCHMQGEYATITELKWQSEQNHNDQGFKTV